MASPGDVLERQRKRREKEKEWKKEE